MRKMKFKGSSLLVISIVAGALTSLIAVNYAKILNAAWGYMSEHEISLNVQKLAVAEANVLRSSAYNSISLGPSGKIALKEIGKNTYYKSIDTDIITDSITGEKAKKSIVKIYANDETSPRVSFDIRRNEKSMPLYSDLDFNEDGALTQKAIQENFITREEAARRPAGAGVGSKTRTIYSENKELKASEYSFNKEKRTISDEIAVWDGNTIRYRLRKNIVSEIVADYKLSSPGYIRFVNGLVFAWARHVITSQEKNNRIAVINKPVEFHTLIAQPADCTPYNEKISYYGWVNKSLNKKYDRFYTTNNNSNAEMTVWWIGAYKEVDTSGESGSSTK